MATISTVEDIASAVVYLTEAHQITGEVLHVDGGAQPWQMVTGDGFPPASAEQRLKELASSSPRRPNRSATYVEAVPTGDLLFSNRNASYTRPRGEIHWTPRCGA